MTNELAVLADRVEGLTEPDRATDAEIARVTRWLPDCINPEAYPGKSYERVPPYWFSDAFGLPTFTASLDAAMTLVPPDCEWQVGWAGNSDAHVGFLPDGPLFDGYAKTAALALTAAALRTRISTPRIEKEIPHDH